MWPFLRQEVARACRDLTITPADFKPLSANEWHAVEEKTYSEFCEIQLNYRPTWIWNDLSLKHPVASLAIDFWSEPLLTKFLDPTDRVFLFVNETYRETDKYWWYEGTVAAVQAVLDEVEGLDEWTIIDKKYQWLLCCTHHDVLVGSGEYIAEVVRQYANKSGRAHELHFKPASLPRHP
jgi:hypothetical protein